MCHTSSNTLDARSRALYGAGLCTRGAAAGMPGPRSHDASLNLVQSRAQNAVAFHAYGVVCRHFAGGPDPLVPLTYPEVFAAGAPRPTRVSTPPCLH